MTITKESDFEKLVDSIYQTHCALRDDATKTINYNLTVRNWLVGCYIVEFEQNGRDRAKYGDNLIEDLAEKLKNKGLKGFSISALKNHRTFYFCYPQISQSVIGLLRKIELAPPKLPISAKSQSVIGFLGNIEPAPQKPAVSPIRQSVIGELGLTLAPPRRQGVWPALAVKSEDGMKLPPELLLSRLSHTHFLELIRVEDGLQRLFYEVETIKNNWSVRELKRAIGTSLAFRTTKSINKEAVIAKIKNLKPVSNAEVIRNPYVLEFMDLAEKPEYSESDLEQQILTHLQEFLIELGTGFCFEARQKRITFNNKHYRIDLVFYHRILKCHILIDLKVKEFDHADAGQMNLYLNYYKKNEKSADDNPPIGIILCSSKDDALVEYATAGMDDHLFVSKYLVKLPGKKILANFIKKELNQFTPNF